MYVLPEFVMLLVIFAIALTFFLLKLAQIYAPMLAERFIWVHKCLMELKVFDPVLKEITPRSYDLVVICCQDKWERPFQLQLTIQISCEI